MKHFNSHILVFIASCIISGSFIVAANLAHTISPISLTLLRFFSAALLLMPIVLINSTYRRKLISTLPRSLVISLFYSLFFILQFEALKTTTSINTATLYTLVPFITAVFCVVIFKERISKKRLIIYSIAGFGTCWVIFQGNINSLLNFTIKSGDWIFMIACLSMCCYSISMKLLYRQDKMPVLVFTTLLGGCFWMGLMLLLTDTPLLWSTLDKSSWLNIAYLGVLATLVTSFLYQKTTVTLGPRAVMSYVYVSPALVLIISYFVNGENISSLVIPGVVISAIATILLLKK